MTTKLCTLFLLVVALGFSQQLPISAGNVHVVTIPLTMVGPPYTLAASITVDNTDNEPEVTHYLVEVWYKDDTGVRKYWTQLLNRLPIVTTIHVFKSGILDQQPRIHVTKLVSKETAVFGYEN
jgi:hypothetical protein